MEQAIRRLILQESSIRAQRQALEGELRTLRANELLQAVGYMDATECSAEEEP